MFNSLIHRSALALLAAILHCLTAETAQAENSSSVVTLHLVNGRSTTGQVDAATDDRHLVIRRSSANVVLRTRVLWTSIAGVDIDDQSITVSQLQHQLPELLSDGPRSAFVTSPSFVQVQPEADHGFADVSPYRGNVMTILPDSIAADSPAAFVSPAISHQRVRSLQFMTQPANWDNDAEIDGLLIQIRPIDQSGQLVPVNGTLDLKLTGLSRTLGGQVQHGLSPVEFPVLETWSRKIHLTDFTNAGAVYRLEFQHYRPERDVSVDPIGLTNARLIVPGVGTFAASEDLTLLRPYSQIRDQHQMFRGTRILPPEFHN